jgi:FlaA1/EpsC-like NDP-sugar epimerase
MQRTPRDRTDVGLPQRDGRMSSINPPSSGRTILLTGAGGSIGSRLARAIASSGPRLLVLLDHSEYNLHRIELELAGIRGCARHVPIVGDVRDGALLTRIFERFRPDVVYHLAAFKHVPLLEMNPVAAVHNNAIGTFNLAKAASQSGVERLIMISTDKAVNPRGVMGATKRVAELALLRWSNARSQMKALRLGNVLGSQGSVVPLFLQQISRGGSVTVTHPDVNRYFLTMINAIDLVLTTARLEDGGGIFVPEMGEPMKVLDLALDLIRRAGFVPEKDVQVVFTELRPGDKMSEDLVAANERFEVSSVPGIYRIISSTVFPNSFDRQIMQLADCVHQRNIASILETLCKIVPEYRPSEALLGLSERSRDRERYGT